MLTSENLILKNEIKLYNNIATIGDCVGRLQARLMINPAPQILWEFEVLEESPCVPDDVSHSTFKGTISGYDFVLENVHGSITGLHRFVGSPRGYVITGSSAEARIGEKEISWDNFVFYLPNARCLVNCVEGSLLYADYHIVYEADQEPSLEKVMPYKTGIGGGWRCNLDDGWNLEIFLNNKGKEWVKDENNWGTFLTASGSIYRAHQDNNWHSSQKLNIFDAREQIQILCYLLSFANGGYLAPIVVQATKTDHREVKESVLASSYVTTPLESLGVTWLCFMTNLCSYLSCLPTFENMLRDATWEEAFTPILNWYFQAIQPTSVQLRGKPWQVTANALGAALERLSVAILQHDLGRKSGKSAKENIKNLLLEIGVLESRDGDVKMISVFIDTRNDATHPKQSKKHSEEDMMDSLQYATLWVEEALLWRLGYCGAYRNRIPGSHSSVIDEPRYDLTKRNSNW